MKSEAKLPTVFVIFGVTGDLAKRKILPALFHSFKKDLLPEEFHIIGLARRSWQDDDLRDYIKEILKNYRQADLEEIAIANFLKFVSYIQGFFEDKKSYEGLARKMQLIDERWNICSNKLFYLAVPPLNYEVILNNLHESGLTIPCSKEEGFTRVLIEKPFGKDLKTAEELDLLLGKLFKEEQIYRIDHYLGKEMIQNILYFRFSNNLLEDSWSNKSIEKIEIRLWEKTGVETRGSFYDGLGTLKDVGQNHLLQMLALITMDQPKMINAEEIRKERAKILKTLKILDNDEIKKYTFRAQYNGYQSIEGVKRGSHTETYFKIKTSLGHPRWKGVGIMMESGKRIKDQIKELVIHFRHTIPCFCPGGVHTKNKVIFQIEPQEEIKIVFWIKKAGLTDELEERSFRFTYRESSSRVQYIEEYERLLLDAIAGNQTLFVSTDEIKAMWKFIDPIVRAWEKNTVPLESYNPDTMEPVLESEMIERAKEKVIQKEIAIIGLGKMGRGMSENLLEKGWRISGFDKDQSVVNNLEKQGMLAPKNPMGIIENLSKPRVIWLMLPAGKVIDEVIWGKEGLLKGLNAGDIIIDGGNSFYKDSIKRAQKLKKVGIHFIDVGVSGGPSGARLGASLMIGGERKIHDYLSPLFEDLAVPGGVQFFEGYGAGHFIKMIHNGIEYGMMQAMAEGFSVLKNAEFNLDLERVADVYNHGSVIESKLIGWLEEAFNLYGIGLDDVASSVKRTGEGDWTIKTAKEMGIKTKVIEEAVKFRIWSEKNRTYAGKILMALRNRFGGHSIK